MKAKPLLLMVLLAAAVAALPGTARGGEDSTVRLEPLPATSLLPFAVEWPAEGRFPADVSFLLSAPAGKEGFIRTENGHLALPNGARFRLWGLNATMQAGLPSKQHASIVAANLARRGINCIRFHFLDRPAPVGLIATNRNDTRGLDPAQLDRLDWFIAEVEFVNENSLVEAWFSDRLLGLQTNRPSGTWHDVPPSYAEALTSKYNAWLKRHRSAAALARLRAEASVGAEEPVPRLRTDQFAKATSERFQAEAAFYMDVEREFFSSMSRYLREELGVKSLLLGNSDHNHGHSGYAIVASTLLLDVVDGHVYWQHPHYLTDPRTGRQTGFDIPNTPMVDDPLHSTVVQLSRSAVAGKPYTVSEVNHPFPNEFACEGVPILAAYAALQDWDGLF